MSWLRDDIEDVQAFVLPDGIGIEDQYATVSRSVLVLWRSNLQDRLYQVYINGRFAGVTGDSQQRRLVVQIPSSFESACHLEIVSVEPKDAHIDFSDEIESNTARVKLVLLRSQDLPAGATINIYYDHSTGDIDYIEPLNEFPIPVWSDWHDKVGFGLAQFGDGDFGYESASAIGFGQGYFAHGHFGLDAEAFEWISSSLPLGRYRFGVKVTDARGNESLATETDTIAVIPGAKPVARLDVAGFNQTEGQLILGLSDQP